MANPVKLQVVVESLVPHGAGVYEIKLSPKGRIPRFKSGQFLHLTVDDYDPAGGFWPESRVFSIASSYGSPTIDIVYSVKGAYTRKMETALAIGKEVWVKLPYGEFHIDSGCGRDIVLVAGGTGVSPFIPLINELAAGGGNGSKVRLYYGVRNKDQFLFLDAIRACAEKCNGFMFELFAEEDAGDPAVRTGRLDIDEIRKKACELSCPLHYLSGPPPMIKSFRSKLLEAGISEGNVKIDEWE